MKLLLSSQQCVQGEAEQDKFPYTQLYGVSFCVSSTLPHPSSQVILVHKNEEKCECVQSHCS